MAELMGSDFDLLGVMTRMGIAFGFGDETVGETCRRCGLDAHTFLLICKIYSVDGYVPTDEDLQKARVWEVLQYLRRSHAYYMDVAMQGLSDALKELTEPCGEKHQRIIRQFFHEYRGELAKHFEYEERTVFPYVDEVLAGKGKSGGFTIGQYEESHSNVQEKLEDLKNLVMKYLPSSCDVQQSYKALFYIFLLEHDLARHTLVEDDVLVPIVNRMESHG